MASEPELLAHHQTQAGHLTQAIPLLAKGRRVRAGAGRPAGGRGPPSEGLSIVDRLAPSADRDSLELSLREPLHSALLQWHGWAAPEWG